MSDGSREQALQYAERRLGRPLHPGEKLLDIPAWSKALDEAKARLVVALDEEKRRAVKATVAGIGPGKVVVTAEAVNILLDLYAEGQRLAREEIRRMGIEPPEEEGRAYAKKGEMTLRDAVAMIHRAETEGTELPEAVERIAPLLLNLDRLLSDVTIRIGSEESKLRLEGEAAIRLVEEIDKRVPGTADAASRMVSKAATQGLSSVYEQLPKGTISGWIYSAVMDGGTCKPCRSLDGRKFKSLRGLFRHLPNFGPNPLCLGDGRCRCRGVPIPP